MTMEQQGGQVGTLTVAVLDSEIEAGGAFRVRADVAGWRVRNLLNQEILVHDGDGVQCASVGFDKIENGSYISTTLALPAPTQLGEQVWHAVLSGEEDDGVIYPELVGGFAVNVVRHRTHAAVWDIPDTVEIGGLARFKVGVRSSSGLSVAGSSFEIIDRDGTLVASGLIGETIAPGTGSLYMAEVAVIAPSEPALNAFTLRTTAAATEPHAQVLVPFGLRTVPRPQFTLRIEAVDLATRAGIEGLKVVLHPYRMRTDAKGRAELGVSGGFYTLFVSGKGYIPYQISGEMTGDMSVRAELEEDVAMSPADLWV